MKSGHDDTPYKSPDGDTSTISHLLDSEFERQEPIPLDVIASELKRQSELLVDEKHSDELNSRYDKSHAQERKAFHGRDDGTIDVHSLEKHDGPFDPIEAGSTPMEQLNDTADNPRAPRKSSDVLTDRLFQARRRAENAERQQAETSRQNLELRQQIEELQMQFGRDFDDIHQRGGNGVNGGNGGGEDVEALRRELQLVREQAAQDLESLRQKVSGNDGGSRNVELEAELEAARQELALLRHSVQEKDKVVEDLTGQCRGLEDLVEDRDREMERLQRELNRNRVDEPSSEISSGTVGMRESDPLYTFREKDSSEVLDGTSLIYTPGKPRSWKTYAIGTAAGLLLGFLILEVSLILTGRDEVFTLLFGGEPQVAQPAVAPGAEQPRPQPAPAAAAAAQPNPPTVAAATPAPAPEPSSTVSAVLQDRLRDGSRGPKIVKLPGGSFSMGNKRGLAAAEEQPAHAVEIAPIYIGTHEVSFDEYDRFARATGRAFAADSGWGRGDRPVINVSWDDAQAYTAWLSRQTGHTYRLPTEAEWEYAARAGTGSRYWWGFAPEQGRAICFDCGSQWDNRSTAPIGSLAANPFGLFDTSGNVMEWVQDCNNRNYRGAPDNGSAWTSGDCTQRIVRGGAFNKPASTLRSAARHRMPRESRFKMLGFRVAREP